MFGSHSFLGANTQLPVSPFPLHHKLIKLGATVRYMTLRRTLINSQDIKKCYWLKRKVKKEQGQRKALWISLLRTNHAGISSSLPDLSVYSWSSCTRLRLLSIPCKAYRGSIPSSLVSREVLVPGLLADSPIPDIKWHRVCIYPTHLSIYFKSLDDLQ